MGREGGCYVERGSGGRRVVFSGFVFKGRSDVERGLSSGT